jgi:hypothetical protein
MWFWLVIGFIGPLSIKLVTTLRNHYHTNISVLNHGLHCFVWQYLPKADVPLLPGSRPWRLPVISHQPTTLPTAVSGLSRNGSWSSLCSLGTHRTENTASIIACSLVSRETCPESCSLATAVVLSPVYTAVTWQWVYMSHCPRLKAARPSSLQAYRRQNLLLLLTLQPWVASAFAWSVAGPSTMSWHSFLESWRKTRLLAWRPPALWSVSGSRWYFPCFPDVAAVSGLGPLCHYCISAVPDVSSRTSVL